MLAALVGVLFQSAAATPTLPPGWLKACATYEQMHCELGRALTVRDLMLVHLVVQAAIAPKADAADQRFDQWEVWPTEGDCSSHALTRRQSLIALGMDPKDLTIVLGEHYRDGRWRRHAKLEARIGAEVWVLDSVSPTALYKPGNEPFPWRETARQPHAGELLWTPAQPAG